jgi:hypothetical protein
MLPIPAAALLTLLAAPSVASGPIAVLPVENLSGIEAPIDPIQAALRVALQDRGFEILADETLADFMRRERLRYVGGLAGEMGQALRSQTGAAAVLVSSIDLYQQADPPRFALTARLVTAGDEPRILWMDAAAVSGDEEPGFLGLGQIDDVLVLEARIVAHLADSLAAAVPARVDAPRSLAPPDTENAKGPVPRRFRPRTLYRAPPAPAAARPLRIAVLPFANDSSAKNAGDLLTLQMVRQARLVPGIEVLEPGVVRDALLRAHLIQEEGLSLPQADLVRLLLSADLVLFGEATVYVEAWAGSPEAEVDFSARTLSTGTRQVVCAAISRARGDDGVWFFSVGRVPTAHTLAARLTRGFVDGCLRPSEGERR